MRKPTTDKIKTIVDRQGFIFVHKYKYSHQQLKNLCNQLKREGYFSSVEHSHNSLRFSK